jgi:hypothetical protein
MAKMPEQTHSGVLNRTKVAAQPEAGTRGSKTNDCEATLRKGNVPKSSAVTTVDRDANKGLAKKLASANIDGNPKKRTENVKGGATVKGTGKES